MKRSLATTPLCLLTLVMVSLEASAALEIDAGPDLIITVPQNRLELQATVSGAESYTVNWNCLEAPADRIYFVQYDDPQELNPNARFLCVGDYVLEVSVESNGEIATDKVMVTVNDRTPARPRLRWKPPILENPEVMVVTNDPDWYKKLTKLSLDKDYLIMLSEEYSQKYGIKISGGRNVVLMGGAVTHDEWYTFPQVKKVTDSENRCLLIQSSPGSVHIEGVKFVGNHLSDAIQIGNTDEMAENSTIQLQNIYVNQVTGSNPENHADIVQTFAGPNILRIDRLTGHTGYQGIFLRPQNLGSQGLPEEFNFRNVNLTGDPDSAYLFWVGSHLTDDNEYFPVHTFPLITHNVYGQPRSEVVDRKDQWIVPKPGDNEGIDVWGIKTGSPPDGDFVTNGQAGDPGVDYVSPGYMDEGALWGEYVFGDSGHVDTGDWIGWLYIQGDYVYSYALPGWWYFPEGHIGEEGAWAFRYNTNSGI